jgi:phage major head subunit gpT-like protein
MPTNVVTPAVLNGIDKSFNTQFNSGRAKVLALFKKIAMTVPSSAKENVYGWLADLPSIGKVAGEYIRKRVQTLGYRLTNETFGGILEVPREAIEDDSYGMFGPMAEMWGLRSQQVVDTEFTELLCNAFGTGAASKDYTGTGFFAANKKAYPKARPFTNVDAEAKKLSAANFEAGLANLQERTDASGVPMYLGQDSANLLLVVCSSDRAVADSIVSLRTLPGGGENPNFNKAQVVVWPGLETAAQTSSVINDGDARPWMILDVSQPVKPFIHQERVSFELTAQFNLQSDAVFNQDLFSWKARGRMAVGYGLPEYAYGSSGKNAA